MKIALLLLAAGVALGACTDPSARTVHLPEGDVEAGKQAFVDLFCYKCHAVQGMEFPPQGASPPTDVTLGEGWSRRVSDNELVTSIINPDHVIDRSYSEELVKSRIGEGSRMARYAQIMTVQQLVDLVALMREINGLAMAEK